MSIENKLSTLFIFLSENRSYNHQVQHNYYRSLINPTLSIQENILSLLYAVANTQSRPNINNLAAFFQSVHKNTDSLQSFERFVQHLNPTAKLNFLSLYNGLCRQRGWGEKTSALFTKTVYHIHSDTYGNELKLWDDAPTTIGTDDTVYLPVDAVILAIFNRIDNSKTWNFHSINQKLSAEYSNTDIVIWDDLWFWGFITQKSNGTGRLFEWNENKYWILRESDKNPHKIDEIRKKAAEFLYILSANEVM